MIRLVLWMLALTAVACAKPRSPTLVPAEGSAPRAAGDLRVGIARVDLTPPPGVSTFGHALDSRVSNGYWTRLYCRIFVLESSITGKFVVAPCDLAAMSVLVHHAVLELIANDPATKDIPGAHVMLAATHTHAGPAHYFESEAYSGATSSRIPGFDPAMVQFLARKIATGVHDAAASLRPAVARWRHDVLWGVTRNRSLPAYNANRDSLVFGNALPPDDAPPEERAIDPRLDVLEIETADAANANEWPLGWLVFFAMHPTVLPSQNRLLGADTHGAISRMLESQLRRVGEQRRLACEAARRPASQCAPTQDPLVGIFNTNEGDMSPKWIIGDHDEVVRVARKVAEKVVAGHEEAKEPWRRQVVLDAHYLQRRLSEAPLLNGRDRLCRRPELGNAAGHGASDHRTSIDSVLPMGSDIDPSRCDCQKPKRGLLGPLQRWLLGRSPQRYPEDVPFAMLRFDDVWLTFVPAELTVHAGELVNERVRRFAGSNAEARIVGLANGYIQYVATEPEYDMQYYEGGSTLYGPKSAAFFADQAELLARAMLGRRDQSHEMDVVREVEHSLGPERHRLPRAEDATPVSELGTTRAKGGLCRFADDTRVALCFWWIDAAPALALAESAPWLELIDENGAPVRVCNNWAPLAKDDDQKLPCDPAGSIDDRGVAFLTTAREPKNGGFVWGTIFRPSESEWVHLVKPVRIRARGRQHAPPIDSDSFSFSRRPPICTFEQAANCQIVD